MATTFSLITTSAALNAFPFSSSPDVPSTSPLSHRTASIFNRSSSSPLFLPSLTTPLRMVACGVALRSESESTAAETDDEAISKVGSRVRVKVPLKVYHVPKVPEIDMCGKEGVIKQYVGVWKGKRISANLPFKVEFQAEVAERGVVKFVAHLREDELEFIG